ncbi:MAG TPA: ankyrin repeat domain-containing protein, partial [Acidobacteriota bacterium]|nr:ankyrin repeat domain-containing protein [Acidobacteriota bacterium]
MSEAFFEAIQKGDAERVREMVKADASLASARNEQGISAPLFALYNQQFEVADAIASARDDLDVFEAAAMGETGRVKDLVDELPQRAVEPASDGFYPLHLACFFGRAETVELLLARDVDANAATANQIRPLHSAMANGDAASRRRIARMLLKAGADPNAQQQGGFTALHSAALHGDKDMAE